MFKLITRGLFVVVVAAGAVAAAPLTAAADPPTTTTQNVHNATESFVDVVPMCTPGGPLYQITTTFNGVLHTTQFDDGRVHVTGTQTGNFTAIALEPGEADANGKFTQWFGFNDNGGAVNGTVTLSVRGTFETGEQIDVHITDHFNVTPTGAAFFFTHCHD
jgi:hypothetical protein